jgi:hypothetical protein
LLPDFTDIFVGAESLESFEALGKAIHHQEGVEILLQVLVRLVSGPAQFYFSSNGIEVAITSGHYGQNACIAFRFTRVSGGADGLP